MSVATPHSIGRTSRISTISESPGSAPRTATGPVAPLMRERSISVTRSSSVRIWPVKQSFVSKVTVSPGSTSSTGWRPGPNDQITWSRVRKCCCDIRWRDGFVLDVNALHVAQAFRSCDRQPDRKHDAGDDPAERDPVRVLDRVRRLELHVLVVEREEEQDDPTDWQHEMEERVPLLASLCPVVPDRPETDQHVDEYHHDHRERRDQREADERPPLPAEDERQHERKDAHPDDRDVGRAESRMHMTERTRREAVSRQRVEDAGRRVHRCVGVRRDRVADREKDDHPTGSPEDLAEIAPRVGARRLRDEMVEAGAEHPCI